VSALDLKTGLQKWQLDIGLEKYWYYSWDKILEHSGNTIFVAGNNNQKIYALDLDTGIQRWSWSHFSPTNSEYAFGLVEDNVLYVDQWWPRPFFIPRDFFPYEWYFALKTEP
jgi:outer membrane protein assembly factor BamB